MMRDKGAAAPAWGHGFECVTPESLQIKLSADIYTILRRRPRRLAEQGRCTPLSRNDAAGWKNAPPPAASTNLFLAYLQVKMHMPMLWPALSMQASCRSSS